MSEAKRLSEAQARRLAGLFADPDRAIARTSGGYMTPTDSAILKKGLAQETGETGKWPSGLIYEKCTINDAGLLALERYLAGVRMAKAISAHPANPPTQSHLAGKGEL